MDVVALRLKPQQDLKLELDQYIQTQKLEAACLLTCVGSLSEAVIRHAGQSAATRSSGPLEIVSLTGVMSRHGSHYHIAMADATGQTWGGHLLSGCLIYTTAEIVIGILPNLIFQRLPDAETGYRELSIQPRLEVD